VYLVLPGGAAIGFEEAQGEAQGSSGRPKGLGDVQGHQAAQGAKKPQGGQRSQGNFGQNCGEVGKLLLAGDKDLGPHLIKSMDHS
jgi:hypothetical protein